MTSGYITTCSYATQEEKLQSLPGRHIIAHYDDSCVVVYQTFCSDIAEFAVTNGYFGGPLFDHNRMTWLKLSFLLTMSLSKWATRPGSERVLAVIISRNYFVEMLETATTTGVVYRAPPGKVVSEDITLLWTPDYKADSEVSGRYTLMIGLRPFMLQNFNRKYIEAIEDITDFVKEQRTYAQNKEYAALAVPEEMTFVPDKNEICRALLLETPALDDLNQIIKTESLRKTNKNKPQVAIMLQGCFNPVHTQHVQIMIECKEWLEKEKKSTVVAGFILVRCDQMVSDKVREVDKEDGLVIKMKHRLAMCELSVMQQKWIYTVGYVGHPSWDACWETAKLKHSNFPSFTVYGADRGVAMCKKKLHNALIVGREGDTEKLKETYDRAVEKGLVNKNNVHIIPVEMENVNSTNIRRILKNISMLTLREDKQVLMTQMVESGWLNRHVADYLVDNEHDLYQNIYQT